MPSRPPRRARRNFTVRRAFGALLAALVVTSAALPMPAVAVVPSAGTLPCAQLLPGWAHGADAIAWLGPHLADIAARDGLTAPTLRDRLLSDSTLWLDACGRPFYVEPIPPPRPAADGPNALAALALSAGQPFLLHSRPGANRVIYLDFDGELISGTAWNDGLNGGADFVAAPYDSDGSPSTFSATEEAFIQDVWSRVSEDFAPFEVDVTTEDPGLDAIDRTGFGDIRFGTRALITHGGPVSAQCGCGGIAYVGVFDFASDHQYYQPALAFAEAWYSSKDAAEVVSHETGHNLGLWHDGTATAGYYEGQGSWAPIMGVGYFRPIVQWSGGDYLGANNTEDDFAVMQTYGAPLRVDDYPDTRATAFNLGAGSSLSASGVIGTRTDVDWFSFSGSNQTTVTVSPIATGPDLDVRLDLYDSGGALIATANPPAATVSQDVARGLDASISMTLPAAGTYFAKIDGVGFGDSASGYSDYGSVGQYTISVSAGGGTFPPQITGFLPTSGAPGVSVTITGTNLVGATIATFHGTPAIFTVDSATQITATVPVGATSGPIDVTTPAGTAASTGSFTVPAPTVSGFSPTDGVIGSGVTISGTNFSGATAVTFNGIAATFTVTSSTSIGATVPAGASTGRIAVTTPAGTATSAGSFTVKPTITGLSPTSGAVGTSVTITGTGFVSVSSVKFNGTSAPFIITSSTELAATVPANATSGPITVTTSGGTASGPTTFTVAPRISSFSPSSGVTGAAVTINGANFTVASAVRFNGVSAGFTINSSVRITATVPVGATTGTIGVTTPAGTATSATAFTVNFVPTVTGFSPTSGAPGASVIVTGTNFTGTSAVKLNGTSMPFTVNSPTQLTATVGASATTGPISVTTPGGTFTSAASFTVAPRITSLSPSSGVIGSSVVINGANFTGASAVAFGAVGAAFVVNSASKITATVPTGATTNRVSVTTPVGTATSASSFIVKANIVSFTPGGGAPGVSVTITGTGFTGASAVKFNGTTAVFSVFSSTQITATVPANATTGPISVTTPAGTATSATIFRVAPRITGFTPTSGPGGTSVTITGVNFTGATVVTFNGVAATFTVNSASKITATVPAGATSGKLAVTTTAGTATSSGTFTVN